MQGAAIVCGRPFGGHSAFAIGLVDGNHVGDFQHAFLQALQIVAGTGQHQHEKEIHHVGHTCFRLADADGFDKDDVKPGRLAQQHVFPGPRRNAAQRSGGRRGTDEGIWVGRQRVHAGLVTQDRAAGPA